MHKGESSNQTARAKSNPMLAWLQVASIQGYQPTPSVLDYACTKVTNESLEVAFVVCLTCLHYSFCAQIA